MLYDETLVCVNLKYLQSVEMPAIVRGRELYLPVPAFLDFLKIQHTSSPGLDSVTGYFITLKTPFLIDKVNNRIRYHYIEQTLNPRDLIKTDDNLYLRLDYFCDLFQLESRFEFRNLSVTIEPIVELPAIRQIKNEQMRRNIGRLKGEIKADTTIKPARPLFNLGAIDWSFVATTMSQGKDEVRAGIGLGGVIAGGETNVVLNYFNRWPLNSRQQYYLWRYVNNDHKLLRQTSIGRISPRAVSSIYSPVTGIQLTNSPAMLRKTFGTYKLTDMTTPGWIVELYVNNVLIDYTQADATGFFSFDVPLVYGNSVVQLRFYGHWGEEQARVQNINIPFNFLPEKEFEYTISAGMVEDGKQSIFSKANFNYGLTSRITTGGGIEYLSSVKSGQYMPFINTSVRLTSNLLLSGEYTHLVRTRGILNYRTRSNMQLELNYTRYKEGQTAIIYNYREERKISLAVPYRSGPVNGLSRVTVNQIILPAGKEYMTVEWLLSNSVNKASIHLNNYMVSVEQGDGGHARYFYGNLSTGIILTGKLIFTPQVQYAYNDRKFISARAGLDYLMFNSFFVNLAYDRYFSTGFYSINLGLRYDFSFSRIGIMARHFGDRKSMTYYGSGSLAYDARTRYLKTDNHPKVGRGGITILPYLDMNGNKARDRNEPKVNGLKIQSTGGRIIYDDNDTLIRIYDLEPYANYYIDLSRNNFEDVSWNASIKSIKLNVLPNMMQLVEVPIAITGEVSGAVDMNGYKIPLKINIYHRDGRLAGQTVTDYNGSFIYSGLQVGEYIVRPDSERLQELGYSISPPEIPFSIIWNDNSISNINFVLKKN